MYTRADQIPILIRFTRWWDQDFTREEEGYGYIEVVEREVG